MTTLIIKTEQDFINEAVPWVVDAVRTLWKQKPKTLIRLRFKRLKSHIYANARLEGRKIGWITLNWKTWISLPEEMRRSTIYHEVGHVYVGQRYGWNAVQDHGPEWRKTMRRLGLPKERAIVRPSPIESKVDVHKVRSNRARVRN